MADADTVHEVTATQRPRIPKILIVGSVLGLALLVIGGVLYLMPQQSSATDEPSRDVEISTLVSEFATQYNIYDSADREDYQQRLSGLLTEEYEADRAERIPVVFDILEPKKQTSTDPKVKSVAIESSDDESAKVLVAVDATVYNTDYDEPTLYQMRWVVSVQLEDGEWRVDAFESVDAEPIMQAPVTPDETAPTPGGDEQ